MRGAGESTGSALGVDVYQMTTLIAHAAEGRLESGETSLGMSFFFRRLPKSRNYVVTAGLRSIVDHCRALRVTDSDLRTLDAHPVLGPALRTPAGQKVRAALLQIDGFFGDIDALPEGTLAFAGPAQDDRGQPIVICGVPIIAYTPILQVRTDMVQAKLIETPWLSRLNYLSMVASKAARIVTAARVGDRDRAVLEFGQRRTHHEAAVDAAYAAYLAGCRGTSNLLATQRFGIPSFGTMDHFAVQASERIGIPVQQSEREFFHRFCQIFPTAATLLVDTYDTWGGIENAVRCTQPGASVHCTGVRLDSNVTPDAVRRARALLDSIGGQHVSIFVSDGLDEWRVRELALAGADGFGVGENITCSPDAATGIGAVGKLVLNSYGKLTMKLSVGSSKATLPGLLQVYRFADHDLLSLTDEPPPPPRDGKIGVPLLVPLWRGRQQVLPLPPLTASRALVAQKIAGLPPHLSALEPVSAERAWPIQLSAKLRAVVEDLVRAAVAEAGQKGQS